MARIGILTCSNATQDMGCSSVVCLADLRKRKGAFAAYPREEPLDLVGIINCPGCLTLAGPEKLLQRLRALTEFRVQAIHFSNCFKELCPFKEKYLSVLKEKFPEIHLVMGTHAEQDTGPDILELARGLFSQPRRTMVDVILNR